MRSNHLISAAVSCALCAVSCVQSPEPALETEAQAPAIETNDQGDPIDDPNLDVGIGSSPPPISPVDWEPGGSAEPEGCFVYNLCCLLRNGPTVAREAFCRSQANGRVRNACYSHAHDRPVE